MSQKLLPEAGRKINVARSAKQRVKVIAFDTENAFWAPLRKVVRSKSEKFIC